MIKKFFVLVIGFVFLFLAACQSAAYHSEYITGMPAQNLIPELEGGQYQVELISKKLSTSFIWVQLLHQNQWVGVATSLTGQPLFQLVYQDKTVKTLQVIPELTNIPLKYLMRDIFWATQSYAFFKKNKQEYEINQIEQDKITYRFFRQNNRLILKVSYLENNVILIDNQMGKYQLFLTPLLED